MTVVIDGNGLPASNYATITVEKGDINQTIVALGVRVYGTLRKDKALDPAWALLREIYAEATGQMVADIRLTATDPPATINEIYNATAYSKILDTSVGCPNVITDDAGECSEIEAKQYARKLLQQGLRQSNRRQYKICAELPALLPEKGDTLQMPDGFTGVLMGSTYSVDGDAETLVVDLVDFNTVGY
jgi:hypothetical protein